MIFKIGDELDLKGKNKWTENSVEKNRLKSYRSEKYIVEAVYNNGTYQKPSEAHFKYKSSNTNVAQVSKDGIIKFVGTGAVRITVTLSGVSGSTVFAVE